MRDDAATMALTVENGTEEFPVFKLLNQAFAFPAANLFIKGVKELLPGGGAGKGRTLEHGATEAALVTQAFGRAIEGDSHAVKQVNNLGTPVAHFLDGWLMLKEVAAVDGVVQVEIFGIALLAGQRVDGINATLRADAM